MDSKDFTTVITVPVTPQKAIAAIKDVRGWWSQDIEGRTDASGELFHYRYRDHHRCTMKIVEIDPDRRVVWSVLSNYFDFTEDPTEWTGTTVSFDVAGNGRETEVRLTHHGLRPDEECYDICVDGWTTYMNSLRDLITTGKGRPNVGQPMNDRERAVGAPASGERVSGAAG